MEYKNIERSFLLLREAFFVFSYERLATSH